MEALVQLRGEVNQSQAVRDTLSMLNLHRVNHCTLVPETDAYRGMITKVNDWVAHGEPSAETVALLIRSRGEPATGDRATGTSGADEAARDATATETDGGTGSVDDEWVATHTDYDDVDALAAAIVDEETTLSEEGLSPTLRLHPPRGGHDGVKHPIAEGGALGKQSTEAIDDLLYTMR